MANPYRGALGEQRLRNLRAYLARAAALRTSVALIGEAPGYRGCAVTGIPFTSRQLLSADTGRWGIFSAGGYAADAALGAPWAEPTATLVWRHVLRLLPAPPVVGNAFPFHPHPAGRPDGNRPLKAAELDEGAGYLCRLLDLFPGVQVIAVGRQAERALRHLGRPPAATLRHPSHGGSAAFAAGLARLTHTPGLMPG